MSAKSGWRTLRRGIDAAAKAYSTPLPGFFFNEDWMLLIVVGIYMLYVRLAGPSQPPGGAAAAHSPEEVQHDHQ